MSVTHDPNRVKDKPTATSIASDDWMLLDGTVNGVRKFDPKKFALGTDILTVPTIAALKGVSVDGFATNTAVDVLGYHTAGDGGGGQFYFVIGSLAVDNGGTVFAPTAGNGRWFRVIDGLVSALWFGAIRTGGTLTHVAIQAAVDYVESVGGGCVLLPCGTYLTSGTVTLGGFSVVIEGECSGVGAFGSKGSFINYQGDGEAFVIGDRVNEVQYGHGIRNLTIMGTAAGKCGIRMGGIQTDANNQLINVQIHNVSITGFTSSIVTHPTCTILNDEPDTEYAEPIVGGCGMFIHRGVNCLVTQCDFWGNWNGVTEASAHVATTYAFINCYFHVSGNVGLRLCSSVSFVFRSCHFESNLAQGVLIKPHASGTIQGLFCGFPMFLSCYWERNGVTKGEAEPPEDDWSLETSGQVIHLVVRDANMASWFDSVGGVRIGDGAFEFRLDNVVLGRATAVAISTHNNPTGLVIGPSPTSDNLPQGSYDLGTNTALIQSLEDGRLKLGGLSVNGHAIFTPDDTYDIGQPNDNQPRYVYARRAVFNNPDAAQLQLVNSVGKYYTLEVNANGVAAHNVVGPYPAHFFYQSIESLGDLESSVATKGLVLRSPAGDRWLFKVDNAGALSGTNLGPP